MNSYHLSEHALGRLAFLENGLLYALSQLVCSEPITSSIAQSPSRQFSDEDKAARHSAHCAVEMCCRSAEGSLQLSRPLINQYVSRAGAKGVLEAGLIPLCVEKLGWETDTELKV